MSTESAPDAVLVGGPRDGTLFTAGDSGIVQLEIDGLVERYVRTTRLTDRSGQRFVIFAYDGVGSPYGEPPEMPV